MFNTKDKDAFIANLSEAVRRDERSIDLISQLSGMGDRSLYNTIHNRHWLRGDKLLNVCRTLGVTPNYLYGFEGGSHASPSVSRMTAAQEIVENALRGVLDDIITIDHVMDWLSEGNATMANFERIAPYVDLYEAPTDRGILVSPLHVGSQGLAAEVLGASTPVSMSRLLEGTDLSFCARSAALHKEVLEGRFLVDLREIDEVLPDGRHINLRYKRLVCRVESDNGPVILTFAQRAPTPVSEPLRDKGQMFQGAE